MRRLMQPALGAGARVVVGAGVSAVFVVLFLRGTDFGEVAAAFRRADVPLILLGIVAYFAGVWFRAVRWHYLFVPIKVIPSRQLFPFMAIGYATNNLMPARTGEVVRIYVFSRRFQVSQMAALGSIAKERLFDGFMFTIFLCVGMGTGLVGFGGMVYPGDVLLAAMAFLLFGVSIAFVLAYLIVCHPAGSVQLVERLARPIPWVRDRSRVGAGSFIQGLQAMRNKQLFLAGLWTSGMAWGFESLTYYLVGEGFGLDQPFPVYLLIAAAANLIIAAPSTSGGVGPFEWATKSVLLIFLGRSSGNEELAIAYAASLHGLILVPITIVGLGFLWLYHVPVRRFARGRTFPPPNTEPAAEARPR